MKTPATRTYANGRCGAVRAFAAVSTMLIFLSSVAAAQQPMAPTQQTLQKNAQMEVQQQIQRVQGELHQVNSRIEAAEKKALSDEKVQQEKQQFQEVVRNTIVKEEPALKPVLKKQDEILNELVNHPDIEKPAQERGSDFNALLAQYQQVNAQVQPAVKKAVEAPQAQEANKRYETVLVAAMQKEEPDILSLYNQRAQLNNQYQRLLQAM